MRIITKGLGFIRTPSLTDVINHIKYSSS